MAVKYLIGVISLHLKLTFCCSCTHIWWTFIYEVCKRTLWCWEWPLGCVVDRSTLKRCHFAVEFARQLPVEGVSMQEISPDFIKFHQS